MDAEIYDKSKTNLEGIELGRDQPLCRARPSCVPAGPALGSWPDTRVDIRPSSSLSVGLVYVSGIPDTRITSAFCLVYSFTFKTELRASYLYF